MSILTGGLGSRSVAAYGFGAGLRSVVVTGARVVVAFVSRLARVLTFRGGVR